MKQIYAYQHPEDKALMEMGGNTWAPKMYDLHRNLERGAAMNGMVANMSAEDVEAVALYLNTMNR
jgi:cytochrome c553